jgi:hypothetical protein
MTAEPDLRWLWFPTSAAAISHRITQRPSRTNSSVDGSGRWNADAGLGALDIRSKGVVMSASEFENLTRHMGLKAGFR